jgi:hypothetical protein
MLSLQKGPNFMGLNSQQKEKKGVKHVTKAMNAATNEAIKMDGCGDELFKRALKNAVKRAEYMIKDTFRMQPAGGMPKRLNLKAGNDRRIRISHPRLTGELEGGVMQWEWSPKKVTVEQGSYRAYDMVFDVISTDGILHNGMLRELAEMLHHDLAYSSVKNCRKAVIGALLSRGRAEGLILMSKKLTGNLYHYRFEKEEDVKKKLLSLGNNKNRKFILSASLATARTYYSGFLPQNTDLFHELVGEALANK